MEDRAGGGKEARGLPARSGDQRQFAPALYLGCVPIARSPTGGLVFGSVEQIVAWAVHMRRFERSALPSSIAQAIGIPSDLARQLADTGYARHTRLAHAEEPPIRELMAWLAAALAQCEGCACDEISLLLRHLRQQCPSPRRRWTKVQPMATCADAMAIFILPTSSCGKVVRLLMTRSRSTTPSPPSTRFMTGGSMLCCGIRRGWCWRQAIRSSIDAVFAEQDKRQARKPLP